MKIYQTNWYVCILQHTRRVDNWYVYFNVFDRHFSRMLQASCRIYEKLFTELSFEHQIICIPYEYCVMETVEMRWCSTERCTSHWKFSRLYFVIHCFIFWHFSHVRKYWIWAAMRAIMPPRLFYDENVSWIYIPNKCYLKKIWSWKNKIWYFIFYRLGWLDWIINGNCEEGIPKNTTLMTLPIISNH